MRDLFLYRQQHDAHPNVYRQQVAVVRRLVADLDIPPGSWPFPPCAKDGAGAGRPQRPPFPRPARGGAWRVPALLATRNRFGNQLLSAAGLAGFCRGLLEAQPAIAAIDYVATVDPDTMDPWESGPCMLAVAVRIGSVGLIDNRILN